MTSTVPSRRALRASEPEYPTDSFVSAETSMPYTL